MAASSSGTVTISLLSSDDEQRGEQDVPSADSPSASVAAAETAAERRPVAKRRRRRGGGRSWRRRAGDASASSTRAEDGEAAAAAELASGTSATELRAALLAFGLRPGGGAKPALALRLLRARRAAAVSEERYGVAASDDAGATAALRPRFDGERSGHVRAAVDGCRLCGGAIRPPKKTFCCDERVFTPALPLFSP
uniref:SAP domain-containing protein n=1 Tax=Emiliania huxleyi TaxID=2903 RepID=A0A6V2RB31_EMIHU